MFDQLFPNRCSIEVLVVPRAEIVRLMQEQLDSAKKLVAAYDAGTLPPDPEYDTEAMRMRVAAIPRIQRFVGKGPFKMTYDDYKALATSLAPFIGPDEFARRQAAEQAKKNAKKEIEKEARQ